VPKLRDRLSYTSAGHDADIPRREFRSSATITSGGVVKLGATVGAIVALLSARRSYPGRSLRSAS
jgi:hypothetical protein